MKVYLGLMISLLLLSACNTTPPAEAERPERMKTEHITTQGKYGTIQEERIRAMRSEIRYIPHGSENGYDLIDPSLEDSNENAHNDSESLVIPSWKIKLW